MKDKINCRCYLFNNFFLEDEISVFKEKRFVVFVERREIFFRDRDVLLSKLRILDLFLVENFEFINGGKCFFFRLVLG